MEIGKKIMNLRKKNGMSQEELAEQIGVARQTISKWELGETYPDLKQSKELSRIFSVSLDELVDNDIKDVVIEKISNTEKLAGMILKIVKIFLIGVPIFVVLVFLLLFLLKIMYKSRDTGREIEESIHCELYGEEHGFSITYQEYTGVPIALGGDTYFSDILDLDKYNDAHQIFNVINDYVKKNGGSCTMIKDRDLNDIVDISIKEGTLSKTGATVIIKERVDYDITYGEPFWIEKYSSEERDFVKLEVDSKNNCGFILPAYGVSPDKPLELTQNWSCFYGELDKGLYRLVKNVDFESDIPVDENDSYYIWVEFEIE